MLIHLFLQFLDDLGLLLPFPLPLLSFSGHLLVQLAQLECMVLCLGLQRFLLIEPQSLLQTQQLGLVLLLQLG